MVGTESHSDESDVVTRDEDDETDDDYEITFNIRSGQSTVVNDDEDDDTLPMSDVSAEEQRPPYVLSQELRDLMPSHWDPGVDGLGKKQKNK